MLHDFAWWEKLCFCACVVCDRKNAHSYTVDHSISTTSWFHLVDAHHVWDTCDWTCSQRKDLYSHSIYPPLTTVLVSPSQFPSLQDCSSQTATKKPSCSDQDEPQPAYISPKAFLTMLVAISQSDSERFLCWLGGKDHRRWILMAFWWRLWCAFNYWQETKVWWMMLLWWRKRWLCRCSVSRQKSTNSFHCSCKRSFPERWSLLTTPT